MRDIRSWKSDITNTLKEYLDDEQLTASEICDIELGLTLWYELFPEKSADNLWGILTGYDKLILKDNKLSEKDKKIIAIARFYLVNLKSRKKWLESLDNYSELNESIRLYQISDEKKVKKIETAVAFEREEIYNKILKNPPSYKEINLDFASHGENTYFIDKKSNRVVDIYIPESWENSSRNSMISNKYFAGTKERAEITIKWDELIETAKWIDEELSKSYYYNTLKDIELITSKKTLLGSEREITIDGLFHLVGMLSTGKSVFIEVLAVWAAKNNLHTTIILDSVISIINMANIFEKLGIKVAPIFGNSNRAKQLQRFHSVNITDNIVDIKKEKLQGIKWLNTACPMAGLTSVPLNIDPGTEPCNNLYNKNPIENKYADSYICPYIYKCPVHEASNSLANSSIWLATPASMVYTQVPAHIIGKKILFYELIYRRSDFLLIDEVDRVQVQLDNFFAPSQNLVDKTGNLWFDNFGLDKSRAHFGGGRYDIISSLKTKRWSDSSEEIQASIDSLMHLLLDNIELYKWIKEELLTTDRIRDKIITELEIDKVSVKKINKFEKAINNFLNDPLGYRSAHHLTLVSSNIVNNTTAIAGKKFLNEWISEVLGERYSLNNEFIDKIILLLILARMEADLLQVLNNWDEVKDLLDLQVEKLPYFQRILDDYLPIVPESPMGNIFGFKYMLDKDNKASLHMFRFKGLGRYLLLRFPELFYLSDGYKGPHTIAISGTSWAPGSSYYHFQKEPDLVLKTNEKIINGARNLNFRYRPMFDNDKAILVSGSKLEDRSNNLLNILNYLTQRNTLPDKPDSILEREIENIKNEDRRKILILVGSYQESRETAEYLRSKVRSFPGWSKEDIIQLVSDNEEVYDNEGIIQRGKVQSFSQTEARVLIAPLLAIERGHNILNENNVAAFGIVYFLVRPMPVPTDLLPKVLSLNHWAVNILLDTSRKNLITQKGIGVRSGVLRSRAVGKFKSMLKTLDGRGLINVTEQELKLLYWNQFVVIWQAIGRLIRGGVGAEVIFADAAFAKKSAYNDIDSLRTSMLIGIEEILSQYFKSGNKNRDFEYEIARNLYSPFYNALKEIEGVYKNA